MALRPAPRPATCRNAPQGDLITPSDPTEIVAARQSLADRYGAPAASRRRLTVGVVTVVSAALLTWLVWAGWHHANPSLEVRLASYDVVSPHRVDVRLEVQRSDGQAVTCTVQAQADDHTIVGQQEVTIPAAPSPTGFATSIETGRQATSASVSGCR